MVQASGFSCVWLATVQMKDFDQSFFKLNDLEAPGWEETKHPFLSLVFISCVGYSLLAFLKVRSLVERMFHPSK